MGFDYLEHPNYIRLPFSYIFHRENYSTTFERAKKVCTPNKKYFACFLARRDLNEFSDDQLKTRQGITSRAELFDTLSEYKFIASGGHFKKNVDGPGPRVRELNEEGIKQWRDDNINWISKCKFMIAYENKYTSGYMTEKLYQGWSAGAVPIYTVDKDVLNNNEVNKKAFINALDFTNTESVANKIIEINHTSLYRY